MERQTDFEETNRDWRRVRLTLPASLRDPVAGLLPELGSTGAVEVGEALEAYFPGDLPAREIRDRIDDLLRKLRESGFDLADLCVESDTVAERDWTAEWKRRLLPIRFDCGIVIVPAGQAVEETAAGAGLRLEIESGSAFGSGHHETTERCACLIREHAAAARVLSDRFLDVGSGTGLLAAVAARCGFGNVTGVEIDPDAARVAEQNMTRNGLDGRVNILEGSMERVSEGPYGMIAANLLSNLLLRYMKDFERHLSPGGLLIASGMLAGQEGAVLDAMKEARMLHVASSKDGRWVTLLGRKNG